MYFMRSWMFVPGNSLRFIEKAFTLKNLDVAMLDIEDGVIPTHKAIAREQIVASLKREKPAGAPTIFVRINSVGTGADRIDADLATVIVPGLDGLIIPKVEDPADVHFVETFLDKREKKIGIEPGHIKITAAIESAKGLINGPAIAASSPRLVGLMFGAEDYALDLGLPSNRVEEARQLLYARRGNCEMPPPAPTLNRSTGCGRTSKIWRVVNEIRSRHGDWDSRGNRHFTRGR